MWIADFSVSSNLLLFINMILVITGPKISSTIDLNDWFVVWITARFDIAYRLVTVTSNITSASDTVSHNWYNPMILSNEGSSITALTKLVKSCTHPPSWYHFRVSLPFLPSAFHAARKIKHVNDELFLSWCRILSANDGCCHVYCQAERKDGQRIKFLHLFHPTIFGYIYNSEFSPIWRHCKAKGRSDRYWNGNLPDRGWLSPHLAWSRFPGLRDKLPDCKIRSPASCDFFIKEIIQMDGSCGRFPYGHVTTHHGSHIRVSWQ